MNRTFPDDFYERMMENITRAGIRRRTETGRDMPQAEWYAEVALITHAGAPHLGEQMTGECPDVVGPLLWGNV